MLRFIIKRKIKDGVNGMECESFSTIDGDLQLLELVLKSGGYGENCYEINELIGVELIEDIIK